MDILQTPIILNAPLETATKSTWSESREPVQRLRERSSKIALAGLA